MGRTGTRSWDTHRRRTLLSAGDPATVRATEGGAYMPVLSLSAASTVHSHTDWGRWAGREAQGCFPCSVARASFPALGHMGGVRGSCLLLTP